MREKLILDRVMYHRAGITPAYAGKTSGVSVDG